MCYRRKLKTIKQAVLHEIRLIGNFAINEVAIFAGDALRMPVLGSSQVANADTGQIEIVVTVDESLVDRTKS